MNGKRQTEDICCAKMQDGQPRIALELMEQRIRDLGIYKAADHFLVEAAAEPKLTVLSEEITQLRARIPELIGDSSRPLFRTNVAPTP
jgi:hypothetical protein